MKDSRVETRITRVLSKNQNMCYVQTHMPDTLNRAKILFYIQASPYGISTIFIQSTPNKYDHKIMSYSLANRTPTDE